MGKDRYSDDHIIEVLKGTKTVTIKDNLAVDSDITLGGDIISSGNLTIDGDVTIAGNLTIDGDVTIAGNISGDLVTDKIDSTDLVVNADSIEVNCSDVTFSSTPERKTPELRYRSYHASGFTWADPDSFVGDGPNMYSNAMFWRINEDSNYTIFACPINNIPNGSIITSLKFYYTPGHSADDIGASFWSVSLADGSATSLGSQNFTINPNVYSTGSISPSSIPAFDYQDNIYFMKFSAKNGSSSTYSTFFGARILYQTNSVGL